MVDNYYPQLNPLPDNINILCNDWKLFLPKVSTDWQDVSVPFQVTDGNGEYIYEHDLQIPKEWDNQKVFLRFEGANCYAMVYIDDQFVRDHYGGFVSWECDITKYTTPGKNHRLKVTIADKHDEINPFHRGGLIRDVILYTLPQTYLSRLHVDTTFDKEYTNAVLAITVQIEGSCDSVSLTLTAPSGETIELPSISADSAEPGKTLTVKYPVKNPLKWDSEHPNLYTLTASVIVEGNCAVCVSRKIGLRQIERRGKDVFINGDPIKLRGVNRHDIHPISGRAVTRGLVEEDVRMFKAANINFIRTSHYPPRTDFLELCDRYGIYVEDEIAVSFLGYGCPHYESDPAFTERFMEQFAEMIERDRSHPCVIIWSLGNESYWGSNIALMNTYAHKVDPGRLTIFSYPLTQFEDDDHVDIWSTHYDRWDKNLSDLTEAHRRGYHEPSNFPVLHDESTHIPCYSYEDLSRDPGLRDFWGHTINRFWSRLWETKGALGCAVWAGIDDVVFKNDEALRSPAWGIIDGWRRPKPEYWHIRKSFSPVHAINSPYAHEGQTAQRFKNRFNHTNFREVRIDWKQGEISGSIMGPDIPPREEGLIIIPSPYVSGQELTLEFRDAFGFLVDEVRYILDAQPPQIPQLGNTAPSLEKNADNIKISGKDFHLTFSMKTGLIIEGLYKNEVVLKGGPYLHLQGLDLGVWELGEIKTSNDENCIRVNINGAYGKVEAAFVLRVDNNGLMETTYNILNMPYPSPRQLANSASISNHTGGYEEVGLAFVIPKELNTLSWRRTGMWNVYPDWHIARLEGEAPRCNPKGVNKIACNHDWPWQDDELDWALFGKYDIGCRGTRDFTSSKTNILHAALKNEISAFTALSDGSDTVRAEQLYNPVNIIANNNTALEYHGSGWLERDTKHKSTSGTETISNIPGDYCQYNFTGTGIAFFSSFDVLCGKAKIYIDGVLKDELDLGVSKTGKTYRGYRKYYRRLVYSIQELSFGKHTIRVEVTGEKGEGSCNCYVNIDHFLVLDGEERGDIRFMINSEINYPTLSWGNYTHPPIEVKSGYTRRIFTKMGMYGCGGVS